MTLQKKEAIKYGWQETKNNFWVIVGTFTASVVIPAVVQNLIKDSHKNPYPILTLLSFLLSILIACGITKFVLDILHKKQVDATYLYKEQKYYLPMLLSSILNALAVGAATLLLLVPGIIVALKLSMYKYFIVEKNMTATDALKASWELTNGYVWELFLFALLRMGVFLLGILALGVGVLVAIPVADLAKVQIYSQLQKK
jgi:uncharacterized membrane protein